MSRRWDFRLVTSEGSLEVVGNSARLLIISWARSLAYLQARTKGIISVFYEKRSVKFPRTTAKIRHQSGAIEPCGDGGVTRESQALIFENSNVFLFFGDSCRLDRKK